MNAVRSERKCPDSSVTFLSRHQLVRVVHGAKIGAIHGASRRSGIKGLMGPEEIHR